MSCARCGCDFPPDSTPHVHEAPPPIQELKDDDIKAAIDIMWGNYPDCRTMTVPAALGMVMRTLGTKPHEYRAHEERLRTYMIANCKIVKGARGGMVNPKQVKEDEAAINQWNKKWETAPPFPATTPTKTSYGALIFDGKSNITDAEIRSCVEQLKTMNDPTKAINNHTCPHCKTNEVNKDERSCWKCGGSLQ